jgi:hypothetical protein
MTDSVPPPPPYPPPLAVSGARPWYRSPWWTIAMLVFVFPWGLYLLWTNRPSWSMVAKVLVSVVIAGIWIPIIVVAAVGTPKTPTASATPPVSVTPSASATPTLLPTPTTTVAPTPVATPIPTVVPTPPPTAVPTAPPTAVPTARPTAPPPNICGAPSNPWNYNFCGGGTISSPSSNFCNYFHCIPSFWQSTNGYVEECQDSTYSHSGGRSGSCSSHGGNLRALYA